MGQGRLWRRRRWRPHRHWVYILDHGVFEAQWMPWRKRNSDAARLAVATTPAGAISSASSSSASSATTTAAVAANELPVATAAVR